MFVRLPCKNCGSPVPPDRSKRTCSIECEKEWSAIAALRKKEYNKQFYIDNNIPKFPCIIVCEICKKDFETMVHRKYCDDPLCTKEAKKRVSTAYMKKYRKKHRVEKIDPEEGMHIPKRFLDRRKIDVSTGSYNL